MPAFASFCLIFNFCPLSLARDSQVWNAGYRFVYGKLQNILFKDRIIPVTHGAFLEVKTVGAYAQFRYILQTAGSMTRINGGKTVMEMCNSFPLAMCILATRHINVHSVGTQRESLLFVSFCKDGGIDQADT